MFILDGIQIVYIYRLTLVIIYILSFNGLTQYNKKAEMRMEGLFTNTTVLFDIEVQLYSLFIIIYYICLNFL